MPSSLSGLLVFIVLLAPGFAYALAAERAGRPTRQVSVFRETGNVVLASVFANTAVLLGFALVRVLWPGVTPDVGALVTSPQQYWELHYASVALWALALIGAACALAHLWGAHGVGRHLARRAQSLRVGQVLVPRADVEFVSAWHLLLKDSLPDHYRHVRCLLVDGTEVSGWLSTFNHDPDETADRDMVLSPPLLFRDSAGAERTQPYGAAAITARHIQLIEVTYHEEAPED